MISNKTEYPINHANAYTNNTFSLIETEKNLKRACFNSFNYLERLQKSYVGVHRFNLTETDLYRDYNDKICLTIDKDFIDFPLRKEYRASDYYNKFVGFQTLCENPSIFAYIPIVIIDGKTILSYLIKSSLDGTTTIQLPNITVNKKTYMSTPHNIEVVFIKDIQMHSFSSNINVLELNNWKLPASITGMSLKESQIVFILLKEPGKTYASNIYIGSVAKYGYLRIDKTNPSLYEFISNNPSFEIVVIAPEHIYETPGMKQIHSRIDTGDKSASLVLSPEDGKTYNMTIPPENLLILKINKETGESVYENKRTVYLHYPNIYEIESNDVDETQFEYKVYYFYRDVNDYLKYPNKMMFIHNFIANKLGLPFEDAVNKLIYETYEDESLQKYFLSIFNYEDPTFTYDIGDFFETTSPYDFDYKTNKMREFISQDSWILRDYAKSVSTPMSTFYLFVKDIDLDERIRMNTESEALNPADYIYFSEPHYVFAFRNETSSLLNLRFFIDGDFYPNLTQINSKFMDYIYVPTSIITENSYIEIERHYDYVYHKDISFTDTTVPVEVDFSQNPFVLPTLNDLYITDSTGNKVDRGKFKIYTMVDFGDFDISDYINNTIVSNGVDILLYEDILVDENGDTYICINDRYVDGSESIGSITLSDDEIPIASQNRIPVKYVILNKIKVLCTDNSMVGQKYRLNVNKTSHLFTTTVESNQTPHLEVFGYHNAHGTKKNFIRIFINGKYIPLDYNYVSKNSREYIVPRCRVKTGDVVSLDVTPFSYDMICELDDIPSDFMVDLKGSIPAPFDSKYYSIYLNGRKMSDNNIEAITPTKIKLFNVHSSHNLYIFKRDRDYEFYGFEVYKKTPIDEFLALEYIPNEFKEELINQIIYYRHGDVNPGDNDEPDWNSKYLFDDESTDEYNFYFDIIIPQYVASPNSLIISSEELKTKYPSVYEKYSNKNNRVVVRPNFDYNSKHLLMIGKCYDGVKIL